MANTMTTELDHDDTPRDAYVTMSALAIALAVIDALPPEHRSVADQADMRALLERFPSKLVAAVSAEARRKVSILRGVPAAAAAALLKEIGLGPKAVS
jgi:hypothetical protein